MMESGLRSTRGAPVPLLGVAITGEVLGAQAVVKVRQRYRNTEAAPVEAIYTFPLPEDAALIGFAMTCAGRLIEGVVREREEAFRAYDDALLAGHGAALLDQERRNVFTASVGNLLPGEETLVDVTYVQAVAADEGALRWVIPTLVAPRYIPGKPAGDRTGHGAADPTDRVPDADRVTPVIGDVGYGIALDVVFDLGARVTIESPSHAIQTSDEGRGRVRARFARGEVALDRDIVLIARGLADAPITGATLGADGTLALTVVPDLGPAAAQRQDVVFVIDRSGSMAGASIAEARAALRLCLRHLREGDRFNVIAFASKPDSFAAEPVPFTQKTLEQADAWVQRLAADGGTELLAPLLAAVRQAPDGVIVLATDGQIGNEDEVLREVLAARQRARIYAFGIGSNVSDVLLADLARRTGGAVEHIHPGERIEEKVVAQFARATAARVTDVAVELEGVEAAELAPAEPPPLVDGQPWTLYARLATRSSGRAHVRGKLAGAPFLVTVPIDASGAVERPTLTKLWAAARVRDLEHVEVTGRHAGRMKERIVALAVAHGVASRHTSFVVVEQRSGVRLAAGMPEARPIPVHAPAGWDLFAARPKPVAGMAPMTMMAGPAAPAPSMTRAGGGAGGDLARAITGIHRARAKSAEAAPAPELGVLGHQLASGLWPGADDEARVRATARALLELLDAGVTTAHPIHGAQVKKTVEALVALAARVPALAALALGAAWLVVSGRRTRAEVERAAAQAGVVLGDRDAVRARVDGLAR